MGIWYFSGRNQMDEGDLKGIWDFMFGSPNVNVKLIDIETPSLLTYAVTDAQAALNFIEGLSLEEPQMCKCNKLIDFLCENHRKAIEYRYHSNTSILESKIVYSIISKHGAWLEVFKFKGDAQNYAREKGYKYHRTVTDFGLTKEVWQHPTQDREYAIVQLEVK